MLLDLLFGRRASAGGGWGGSWLRGGSRTSAGVAVNEETALTYAACWCATRVLMEAESTLPLLTYRRDGEDRELATDEPLFDLLHRSPNPDMASMPFREGRTGHAVSYGSGFAEIEWDSYEPALRTRVVALWPIHASRVQPITERGPYGYYYGSGYRYLVRNNDGSATALRPDEMLHVPGVYPEDGIWGKGVIRYARESIGFGLAMDRHGSNFFSSGAQPPAIIFTNALKDKEARKLFRLEWKETHGMGTNELGILGSDVKYQQVAATNKESEFLQSKKWHISEIARWYRVPTHMLMDQEGSPGGVVEQKSIEFVVYSLMPWVQRWEQQIALKLLLPSQRATLFVEHVLAGLLRGDFQTRMAGYVQALQNGLMTINEVRRLENLNSIGPAGDVNYVQLNMTTADRILAGPPELVTASTPRTPGLPADESADAFTREMLAKQSEAVRSAANLSHQGKPMLALPAARNTMPVPSEAVRGVVADACGRALTKLAKALGRETKLTDFPGWLDGFVEQHGAALADALEPAAAVLGRADVDGAGLWQRLIVLARTELGAAFEADTPAKFAERLAGWPREVAEKTAKQITEQEQPNGPHP